MHIEPRQVINSPSFPFPLQSRIPFFSFWYGSVDPCLIHRLSQVPAFLASRPLMDTAGTRSQFRDDPRESAGCRKPGASPLSFQLVPPLHNVYRSERVP
ncbi:hypothetical protein CGRA01v4_11912 [Colletotrichum graminicola]|nr:hypothetical protein CGRA01v4_11912 [Colletotrichum graminicola]